MKHTIGNISTCTLSDERTAIATGDGGSIRIRYYLPEIIHFSYEFDGVPTDEDLLVARAYMAQPAESLTCDIPIVVSEEEYSFRIDCGVGTVTIEKEYAVVRVFHKGILQHGGPLGNADTVTPDHQLRCIHSQGRQSGFGRFNFPLLPEDAFYGLGDKTGLPNKRGRRYAMFNRDALGYDASNSDPLYKSIPFFIRSNVHNDIICGLFFDHPNIAYIDLGRESPYYYSVETHGNLFSYFTLLGNTYKDVLRHYHEVTGFSALPPLFSFGFFGSSMNYAEPENAQQRILDYFTTIEKHRIPCEGMYLSSGYLKAVDGKRYTFLWNEQKFPNYRHFLGSLAKRGYNLCMNIKPGILLSHPWYDELRMRGYFISDSNGIPYKEFFWGGEASLIDFSNDDAVAWWKTQLKEHYLDHGCAGVWNDNNEFEIEDTELRAFPIRSLYPVKMAQASYEVFKEKHPDKRPWIYSRSGYAGLQRFARTWSGDNVSDWKTLRYNQYMGVGFGLSGLPYFGHDLGGFFGAFPEEELLVRSCQSAVFQGRFVIHSWREDGNPTEPWSYPSSLAAIKELINQHYRFIPYIYNCAVQAAISGTPLERMLKLEFPGDRQIRDDEVNTLFGDSILKVVVADPKITEMDVYLPTSTQWYNGTDGAKYPGGTVVTVSTPCDGSHQWFVKAGAVIPTTTDRGPLTTAFFLKTDFLVYWSTGSECVSWYYEDDGSTEMDKGRSILWKISVDEHSVTFIKVRSIGQIDSSRCFRLISGSTPHGGPFAEFNPDSITHGQEISFTYYK
jgi:alpha-glucosidase